MLAVLMGVGGGRAHTFATRSGGLKSGVLMGGGGAEVHNLWIPMCICFLVALFVHEKDNYYSDSYHHELNTWHLI